MEQMTEQRNERLIGRLLRGEADGHVLPFFWQHGEDETTLREYMRAIRRANCRAVCVESRPHPDFCGPRWWQDMDIILDEAERCGMKVWILDDSHFPTGYANGAMQTKPDALCRQSIFLREYPLTGPAGPLVLDLAAAGLLRMAEKPLSGIAAYLNAAPARVFADDSLLCVVAENESGARMDLTRQVQGDTLRWDKPAGEWLLRVCTRTRNAGPHRDYINMTDPESCRVLLDAVYEPHWAHYADRFGRTIAGFFSDEPELGNGELYVKGNLLGSDQDLPWSQPVEAALAQALGNGWRAQIPLLWARGGAAENAPSAAEIQTRMAYMEVVTRCVQTAFSEQIGGWCRAHGVRYIGHMIEDEGQHCRTGSGLGHYFRALRGQDMAGVDDIGGQLLPQGEAEPACSPLGAPRNGEFYHYGLAQLAESAAAIEPGKAGNAMCELFGNYGWAEGIRLEKYLADCLLVRGINQFVPHAFSPAPFPDPDCPPHFYAHGHNPQFRWFGELMAYLDRAATLTSADCHVMPAAVLYHGEQEWADPQAMPFEKPLHVLCDAQIGCRVLPADVFVETELYKTRLEQGFSVNGQSYGVLVIPGARCLCAAAAEGAQALLRAGVPVLFAGTRPGYVAETGAPLPLPLGQCPVVPLPALAQAVRQAIGPWARFEPANDRLRLLQVGRQAPMFLLTNEGAAPYTGTLALPHGGPFFWYDPLANGCFAADVKQTAGGAQTAVTLRPLHSLVLVSGKMSGEAAPLAVLEGCRPCAELQNWQRSTCEAAAYPAFGPAKPVTLPDCLEQEQPEFSGFVRYETCFEGSAQIAGLEIEQAGECVEVFLDGESLGLRLVPPFRYDLRGKACGGVHRLCIEVATTLERKLYPTLQGYQKMLARKPDCASGLNGRVWLLVEPVPHK